MASGITRRQMGKVLAALGAASRVRGADSALSLDHLKLRVSSLEKSLMFYYSLFGGRTFDIQGGSYLTPPDMRAVALKMGAGGNTYVVLSPPDPKTPVGLEHIAMDAKGFALVQRNNLPLAFPEQKYVRDPDGNLIEFVGPTKWELVSSEEAAHLPGFASYRPPVFDAVAIRRITLRVSDLDRAVEFYKLFGTELGEAASKDRRAFDFSGTVLVLLSRPSTNGLDSVTIAVRNFAPGPANRLLRARGIRTGNEPNGDVYLRDPDGNRVELTSG